MSANTLEIIGICLTALSLIYEFFAFLNRRPDDGPTSILQVIVALFARLYYVITGRTVAFPTEIKFRQRYQQKLISRSTMNLRRKSTIRLRQYLNK